MKYSIVCILRGAIALTVFTTASHASSILNNLKNIAYSRPYIYMKKPVLKKSALQQSPIFKQQRFFATKTATNDINSDKYNVPTLTIDNTFKRMCFIGNKYCYKTVGLLDKELREGADRIVTNMLYVAENEANNTFYKVLQSRHFNEEFRENANFWARRINKLIADKEISLDNKEVKILKKDLEKDSTAKLSKDSLAELGISSLSKLDNEEMDKYIRSIERAISNVNTMVRKKYREVDNNTLPEEWPFNAR